MPTTRAAGSTAPPTRLKSIQDTSSRIKYGGSWGKRNSSSDSGGSIHKAATAGKTASLSFTGRAVAWVAPREHDPRQGQGLHRRQLQDHDRSRQDARPIASSSTPRAGRASAATRSPSRWSGRAAGRAWTWTRSCTSSSGRGLRPHAHEGHPARGGPSASRPRSIAAWMDLADPATSGRPVCAPARGTWSCTGTRPFGRPSATSRWACRRARASSACRPRRSRCSTPSTGRAAAGPMDPAWRRGMATHGGADGRTRRPARSTASPSTCASDRTCPVLRDDRPALGRPGRQDRSGLGGVRVSISVVGALWTAGMVPRRPAW